LINRINLRAESDAVGYADQEVERTQRQVADIEKQLKTFRSEAGFVDAQREGAAALQVVTKLSTELAEIRTSIQERQTLMPNSPALASLREKARSYEAQISQLRSAIGGDDVSIATKMGRYDDLILKKTIAEKALASAESNRNIARQNATQQHLYLQTVIEPNLADIPTYPKRWLYFFLTILASSVVFLIVRNLQKIALEHAL
jgi:capsular polysaccharide transport system permease protein